MHRMYAVFFVFVAVAAAASTGVAATVAALTCRSSDPSIHSAIIHLDETQDTVTFTWDDRLLPDGATKPAKEEGVFQGSFSPQSIAFDINKGDQHNHYIINRQNGVMTDERYEIHHGHQENEGTRVWNCQPSGKAIF